MFSLWLFLVLLAFGFDFLPSVSCSDIDVFQNTNEFIPIFSWSGLFLATTTDLLRVPAKLTPWYQFYPLIAATLKLVFSQYKSDFLATASLSAQLENLRQHLQQDTFPASVRIAYKSRSCRISLLTSTIESKESEYKSLLARCTTSFVLAAFGQQIINQYLGLESTPSAIELVNISKGFAHLRYLIEWLPARTKGSSISESDLFTLMEGSTHDSVISKNLRTFLVCRFYSLMGEEIPSEILRSCFDEKQKKTLF